MNKKNIIVKELQNIKFNARNALTNKEKNLMYLYNINTSIENIKRDLECYLYYLEDKIDSQFIEEADRSIFKFINELKEI